MLKRLSIYLPATLSAALLLAPLALAPAGVAKPKQDPTLPAYILRARTVAVMVDPSAGVSLNDPNANQVAQKDVETALLNWGRFAPQLSTEHVDLIIVVRKGSGKPVDTTISDPRQNNRAGVINPTDDGISIGAQHGKQPSARGSDLPAQPGSPHPQAEVGNVEDSFVVYEGNSEGANEGNPEGGIGSPAGWRYMAKDALHPHNVPAVDEFRKAIAEAEKAAAKQQAKTPPARPATPAAQPQSTPPASPQTNPPAPSSHP